MRVPVLDTNRTPLMPTTPVRARLLLKQGKARPYWNKIGIFCIILTYAVQPDNQPFVVGIDPGSSYEGWSVIGTQETVINGMSEAPKHVKKAVEIRRTMRRYRRRTASGGTSISRLWKSERNGSTGRSERWTSTLSCAPGTRPRRSGTGSG